MFEKVKCNKCEKNYDVTFDECPNCRNTNLDQPEGFKQMTMVKWGKQIALFFVGWLGLQLLGLIGQLVVIWNNGPFENTEALNSLLNSPNVSMAINGLVYGILFITLCLILFDELPKLFKSFKKWQPYVAGIVTVALIFFFNIIYPLFLTTLKISIGNNNNETGLISITEVYPILSLFIFGIIGPICEELTYRVGLFSFLKRSNVILAYILTIIIFALIHFDFSAENIVNELLNLPFYLFAGFIFAFIYDKFGFAASLTAHIINNLISISFCGLLGVSSILL